MGKVKVYTDGACSNNPGPGGWGAVFTDTEKPFVLSGFYTSTTNNRMELLAVVKTIHHICKFREEYLNKGCTQFEIFSDSAYVVNAINNRWLYSWISKGWRTSKGSQVKNADLWKKYLDLMDELGNSGIKVVIHKVKGHDGDTYNEYVDTIAKGEVNKARAYIATKNGGSI